jgi:FkbM family methyltransferase
MSRSHPASPASVADLTDDQPARLTPRHLEEALQVLRDVSLAVDDGRTWKAIHGALTGTHPAAAPARPTVMERQVDQVLAVVSAPPRSATYLGNGLLFLPTNLGFPMIGFADDLQLTPSFLMHRAWDEPTTHLIERLLDPGDRFLDIGANIGYFTVFGALLVGGTGRVYAFEANPRTANVLRRNVRMNTIGHVCTVRDVALGDRIGTATLHTFVGSQASSTLSTLPDRLLDEWHERPREQVVPMTTAATRSSRASRWTPRAAKRGSGRARMASSRRTSTTGRSSCSSGILQASSARAPIAARCWRRSRDTASSYGGAMTSST